MKKTYLVFITSEGQLFEWNIQSLGDTKMHQTWRQIVNDVANDQRDINKTKTVLKQQVKFRKI